jgi:hypothetical protein
MRRTTDGIVLKSAVARSCGHKNEKQQSHPHTDGEQREGESAEEVERQY